MNRDRRYARTAWGLEMAKFHNLNNGDTYFYV